MAEVHIVRWDAETAIEQGDDGEERPTRRADEVAVALARAAETGGLAVVPPGIDGGAWVFCADGPLPASGAHVGVEVTLWGDEGHGVEAT